MKTPKSALSPKIPLTFSQSPTITHLNVPQQFSVPVICNFKAPSLQYFLSCSVTATSILSTVEGRNLEVIHLTAALTILAQVFFALINNW